MRVTLSDFKTLVLWPPIKDILDSSSCYPGLREMQKANPLSGILFLSKYRNESVSSFSPQGFRPGHSSGLSV